MMGLARKWIVPAVSIFVFLSGLLNIVSALGLVSRFRVRLLESVLPWSVLSASRSLTLITGVFLVFLAGGLWRKKKRARRLSLILLTLSPILHLLKGFDFEEAIALLLPAILLFFFRDEFKVESSTLKFFESVRNSILILILLFIYSMFGFWLFQGQFQQPVTLVNIARDYQYSVLGIGQDSLTPRTREAFWFDDSITFVGVAAVLFIFANLFAPVLLAAGTNEEDRKWVRDLIKHYGDNYVDYFALLADKSYFFSDSRKSVIAYKVAAGVAIALSGPIGAKEDKKECLRLFLETMRRRGLISLIYDLNEEGRLLAEAVGLKSIKIGEQAVIKTATYTLAGREMAEVRHAAARLKREGVTVTVSSFSQLTLAAAAELDRLHSDWLARKKIPPLTFSSNFYPLPVESEAFLLLAYSKEAKLLAALSFLPYKDKRGLALDLMLRSEAAFNGLIEGLISFAISHFGRMGKEEVSLALAPLADINREGEGGFITKGSRIIFKRFNALYRYQSLFVFKKKFLPIWEPAYLAFAQGSLLPRLALALLQVSLKSKRLGD